MSATIIEQQTPKKVTDAIRTLMNVPAFNDFIGWIRECNTTEEACYDRIIDEVKFRHSQGRHQAMSAIIEANDGVRRTLQNTK